MIERLYSLVIEATEEADCFGFYSPDLEGFTGIGHSIEDCLYKAKWGMKEHVELLEEQGLSAPRAILTPKSSSKMAGVARLPSEGSAYENSRQTSASDAVGSNTQFRGGRRSKAPIRLARLISSGCIAVIFPIRRGR